MDAFEIVNGDIAIGKGVYQTVSGPAKVEQDIMVAVMTPFGSDRFHPRFGSVFSSYIGTPSPTVTTALIKAELTRVIQNYMRVQTWKVQQAALAGRTSPFAQGELIQSIGAIHVTQQFDSYSVTASVTTASGQTVNVSTTVTS